MGSKAVRIDVFIGRLLVIAGVIASVIGVKLVNESKDHVGTIERLWEKDLQQLNKANKLPKAWSSIKNIDFFGGSDTAEKWIRTLSPPIPTNESGKYRLEVLILSLVVEPNTDQSTEGSSEDIAKIDTEPKNKPQKRYGFILQQSLVEIESNNLVWELGRTFYF